MTSQELRQKFLDFFKERGHVEITPAKLVLENDQTTLFTSSGMQPLIPYLLGEKHPGGKRLVNSQPSFRAEDIDEVGDNRHTTFFEMLGNWSLGDYFKREQLPWIWEFLTEELKLPKEKLYVSVFEGDTRVPKDEESHEIWKSLGVPEDHIYLYGVEKNWWSRSGPPENMPTGEIGGPDSEVFYEFTKVDHDPKFGEKCHPNCDCGRFVEIGNSVFIQYQKQEDGSLKELDQKNVDFGGGLERLVAATMNEQDIFKTDLYDPIVLSLEKLTGERYEEIKNQAAFRVVADHLKAAVFLAISDLYPSNKLHGYILRRLLRRALLKLIDLIGEKGGWSIGLWGDDKLEHLSMVIESIFSQYEGLYGVKKDNQFEKVKRIFFDEFSKFGKTLLVGQRKIEIAIERKQIIDGLFFFDLYSTSGFPFELTLEELVRLGKEFSDEEMDRFDKEFGELRLKHSELSRSASAGIFKGGLAGHSETEIKYHTATHLLHQALRDVLGPEVFQKGSNITPERLRFDFSFDRKLTEEEVKKVEDLINQRIKEDLKVDKEFMAFDEAKAINAIGLFDEKYDKSNVSIYAIGPNYQYDPKALDKRERAGYYSLEFCGGPHVKSTSQIVGIKITKEEAVSSGMRRIRVELAS